MTQFVSIDMILEEQLKNAYQNRDFSITEINNIINIAMYHIDYTVLDLFRQSEINLSCSFLNEFLALINDKHLDTRIFQDNDIRNSTNKEEAVDLSERMKQLVVLEKLATLIYDAHSQFNIQSPQDLQDAVASIDAQHDDKRARLPVGITLSSADILGYINELSKGYYRELPEDRKNEPSQNLSHIWVWLLKLAFKKLKFDNPDSKSEAVFRYVLRNKLLRLPKYYRNDLNLAFHNERVQNIFRDGIAYLCAMGRHDLAGAIHNLLCVLHKTVHSPEQKQTPGSIGFGMGKVFKDVLSFMPSDFQYFGNESSESGKQHQDGELQGQGLYIKLLAEVVKDPRYEKPYIDAIKAYNADYEESNSTYKRKHQELNKNINKKSKYEIVKLPPRIPKIGDNLTKSNIKSKKLRASTKLLRKKERESVTLQVNRRSKRHTFSYDGEFDENNEALLTSPKLEKLISRFKWHTQIDAPQNQNSCPQFSPNDHQSETLTFMASRVIIADTSSKKEEEEASRPDRSQSIPFLRKK